MIDAESEILDRYRCKEVKTQIDAGCKETLYRSGRPSCSLKVTSGPTEFLIQPAKKKTKNVTNVANAMSQRL